MNDPVPSNFGGLRMCFGLDRAQGSSSEEEAEKDLALADDFGLRDELACRLFGLLLAGSDSVSEKDSSIFVGARTSSISAQCSRFRSPFGVPKLWECP